MSSVATPSVVLVLGETPTAPNTEPEHDEPGDLG